MSRTYNRWKNKKTVNHKEYAVVYKFKDVIIVYRSNTPNHKWGKPQRHDQSDRNHKMKLYKERRLRHFYKKETRNLINEFLNN